MEELDTFIGRLERATLQLKALQRTARTTLQVTTDLLEVADELRENLNAQPVKEGTADGSFNGRTTVSA